MKVAFWRATGKDDRWSEFPSLAGLSLEAHAIHALGDEVEFEFCASADELVGSDADVAAISSVTDVWPWALEAIERCKGAGKHVALGGAHVSACPESVPSEVHCAIQGEGEEAFGLILWGWPKKREFVGGELDLEESTHLPIGALSSPGILAAVTSRGCPYRCTFCTAWRMWGKVRRFSAEYVADWLGEHAAEFETVNFHDLTFVADMDWLERFAAAALPAIEAGLYHIELASGRTNLINRPLMELLKRVGVEQIGVGMESCSPPILAQLKPECTVEDHERAVRLAYEYGIRLSASFIVGTPGETDADLQATGDFIERWQGKFFNQGGMFVLTPYPGTVWWEYAQAHGILPRDVADVDWTLFHRCVGTKDWSWDNCLYLNDETMEREHCADWQRRISAVCGERDVTCTRPLALA